MKKILLTSIILLTVSCTDAFKANVGSYGKEHHIRMYNGGQLVAEWFSSGKVETI